MPELGETQDPRALVSGVPEAVDENVRVLRGRAEHAEQTAVRLKSIDFGDWRGPAADAFHKKYSYQPNKWFAAADSFDTAADALEDYAATLRWAQNQAGEAIALWNQGQTATQQAAIQHDALVADAAAHNLCIPANFVDPGEAHRAAARDLLNRARTQLNDVGNDTGQTLREEAAKAPKNPSWLEQAVDAVVDVAEDIGEAAVDLAENIVDHLDDVALAAAGVGLTVVSAGGEALGTILTATGAG